MGDELQWTFRTINNAFENLLTGIIHIELIGKKFQDWGSGGETGVCGDAGCLLPVLWQVPISLEVLI